MSKEIYRDDFCGCDHSSVCALNCLGAPKRFNHFRSRTSKRMHCRVRVKSSNEKEVIFDELTKKEYGWKEYKNSKDYVELEIKKVYLSIGEVATKFHTSTSCIRFYCEQFNIPTARTKNGHRKFSEKSLTKLTKVFELVNQGYHLKFIKEKL